ncbi:hypothetical protein [Hyphobacterium sp.]|uniref:hypothetical protein n=1 Tax=Hyphobacterium sp. TaxID=2004662 RepID=UPI003B51C2AA
MPGVAQSPSRRVHAGHVYSSLKAATSRLLRSAGGAEAVAPVTRGCAETMRNYQRPAHDSFMPADVIADAELDAERPFVTEQLARIAGYQLVPLPDAVPGETQIHTAMREAAEMIAAASAAMADGRVDHVEAGQVYAEIGDAIRALHAAQTWLADQFPHLKEGEG